MSLTAEFFEAGARNVVPDPRFESGLFMGSAQEVVGGAASPAVSRDDALEGEYSLRLLGEYGAPTSPQIRRGYVVDVVAGDSWSFGVDVGHATPSVIGGLRIRWITNKTGPVYSGTVETASAPTGRSTPTRLEIHGAVAPGNALQGEFTMTLTVAAPVTFAAVVFDRVMLAQAAECPEFFDGDSPLCEWEGARFYTPSVRRGEAALLQSLREIAPPFFWSEDQR